MSLGMYRGYVEELQGERNRPNEHQTRWSDLVREGRRGRCVTQVYDPSHGTCTADPMVWSSARHVGTPDALALRWALCVCEQDAFVCPHPNACARYVLYRAARVATNDTIPQVSRLGPRYPQIVFVHTVVSLPLPAPRTPASSG